MNKEKQIIEEKKESVRDFYEREIKDGLDKEDSNFINW